MASAVVASQAWLSAQRPDVRFLTRTTDDLELNLPQVRIVGAGGPQKKNLGVERIVLETFAADEASAIALAQDLNDLLAFSLRGVIGDANVSKVRVDSRPAWRGYSNPNVSQQVATYSIFIRPTY